MVKKRNQRDKKPSHQTQIERRIKQGNNLIYSLSSINIQRGRDHGVQPYVVYREMCGLSRPYSFEDLTNMPKDVINQLRKVYKSVEDIDLWTGLVSEYPLGDAAVGPTQACKFEYFFFSYF